MSGGYSALIAASVCGPFSRNPHPENGAPVAILFAALLALLSEYESPLGR